MAYKIAVGSSDGVNVDLKFGQVEKFLIYEVDEDYKLVEERAIESSSADGACESNGCKSGCGGHGNGCSGPSDVAVRVTPLFDCRCVVCAKVGFQAQKQFEKKAISVFDVECTIKEALDKITSYYRKIDNRQSLRKTPNE